MNKVVVLISLLFFFSCKQEISSADISKINGYWEIEKVVFASGVTKEYKMSETIDYFEVKNNSGFRKKVIPQFDGSYLVNNVFEAISITTDNATFFINYKTAYLSWKEEIAAIQDSVLILKNKDQTEYHYKKAIPFSIKYNGKTTK